MDNIRNEAYRCRQCHTISPLTAQRCSKVGCNALLNIHGEVGEVDEYGNWSVIVNHRSKDTRPPDVIIVDPPKPEPEKKVKEPKPVKTKEPKPVKVKEPKSPKPPKAHTEEIGHSRKAAIVTILIVVFLLLVAVAIGLIWYMTDGFSGDGDSSEKFTTTAAQDEPDDPDDSADPDEPADPESTGPIYAPNFESFVTASATLRMDCSQVDGGNEFRYIIPAYLVERATDEYVDLIEDSYPFKLTDENETTVWFSYTGKSKITTLTSDDSGTNYHIEYRIGTTDDGRTKITITYAEEIELEAAPAMVRLPESDIYEVPDFQSYAKDYLLETSKGDGGYGTKAYVYDLPHVAITIVDDYVTLLTEKYGFRAEVDDSFDGRFCYLLYYEKADSDRTITIPSWNDCHIVIWYHIEREEFYGDPKFILSDSFKFVKTNDVATLKDNVYPNYKAWSHGLGTPLEPISSGTRTYQLYRIGKKGGDWEDIFEEYCNYIANEYTFDPLYTGGIILGNNSIFDGTVQGKVFAFTGKQKVSTLAFTYSDDNRKEQYSLMVFWYISNENLFLGIEYVNELSDCSPISTRNS